MVRVITVHGTNAGAGESRGDQWWQIESAFQKRLQELVVEPLEFEPFHWSGANSEQERRKFGALLAKKIIAEEKPPIVIGHSHGGSVLIHALFNVWRTSKRRPLAQMDSAVDNADDPASPIQAGITVGTPALRYRATWNWFAKYNILAQSIGFLSATTFFGFLYLFLGSYDLPPAFDVYGLFGIAAILLPALFFFVMVAFPIGRFGAKRASRNASFGRNSIYNYFSRSLISLNHSADEAIIGLRSGLHARLNLMSARQLRRAIRPWITILLCLNMLNFILSSFEASIHEGFKRGNYVLTDDQDNSGSNLPLAVGLADFSDFFDGTFIAEEDTGFELYWQRQIAGLKKLGHGERLAHLLTSYKVIDLANALYQRTPEDLARLIETAEPEAPAYFVCVEIMKDASGASCKMRNFALYLSPIAQEELAEIARSLPPTDYAGPPVSKILWNFNPYTPARIVSEGDMLADETNTEQVLLTSVYDYTPSPIRRLLFHEALDRVTGSILVSEMSVPPVGFNPSKALYYPRLQAGDAVVVNYYDQTWNGMFCFISDAAAVFSNFVPPVQIDNFEKDWSLPICSAIQFPMWGAEKALNLLQFLVIVIPDLLGAPSVIDWSMSRVDALDERSSILTAKVYEMREAAGANESEPLAPALAAPLLAEGITILFHLLSLVFGGILYLAMFGVVIPTLLLTWLTSLLLAPLLRQTFNMQMKNLAFGNDSYGEGIVQVAASANFHDDHIGTIPEAVEKAIERETLKHAPKAIQRIREVVSLAASKNASPLLAKMAEGLTWKELIHTAYFDVPEFREHFAKVLCERCGLTLRADSPADRWIDIMPTSSAAVKL